MRFVKRRGGETVPEMNCMFAVVNCDDNRTSHTEQLDSLLAEIFFLRESFMWQRQGWQRRITTGTRLTETLIEF